MRAAPAPTAGRRWPGLPRLRPPPGRSPAGVLTWAGGRGAPGCLGTSWQWTWSLSPKVPSPRPLSGLRKGDSHHGAWLRCGPRRGVLGRFHLPTPWALLDVSPRHGHGATENKGSLLSLWVPPRQKGFCVWEQSTAHHVVGEPSSLRGVLRAGGHPLRARGRGRRAR